MSFKNDSHKGGANTKDLGSIKSTGSAKGSTNTKGGKTTKSAQSTPTAGDKSFQPNDIKSLVQNHGKAKLGGQEWALKAPSWNDSALQAIISDPRFTAKPTGKSAVDGKWTYELCGHGKTIKVTISH